MTVTILTFTEQNIIVDIKIINKQKCRINKMKIEVTCNKHLNI